MPSANSLALINKDCPHPSAPLSTRSGSLRVGARSRMFATPTRRDIKPAKIPPTGAAPRKNRSASCAHPRPQPYSIGERRAKTAAPISSTPTKTAPTTASRAKSPDRLIKIILCQAALAQRQLECVYSPDSCGKLPEETFC
ncbi:hypothetical protein TPEGhana051_1025a [Treponema pallidum subsp. pertenue]|uniref:Uncharacterized protein n=2 Tax=Treponema pallidum TaxID=160 RepID=A0AAU8SBJ6_TREPL|nr:hypothetical protein TPESAMD_1025a [Treponema pallidum subsp. pertenue str. SamoaD]AEZ59238.1 hypothetical protein TPECDC2_1025a [Treponema pallidum subsp. pertenue str. CDC2]AEZ60306.1 hypothetical protein TPEGAU_1025a [Treponema pallidum subsp. pertenue str. Gauthier]AGK84689.1 hypothetical protein TPFB_1025a [Treponema pallidum str. Fribourg-Blanc]AJB41066.1 hypothetical protein TENDBA_1025a [Treponema pallidum subsp. endemicum str. Bosnia A]ASV58696.1 hypothetical protein TPEGhana051_10